jgi:ribosomal protein RSM22 (predicted rRNA methylase)
MFTITFLLKHLRRVWRYQRGSQNPYIEEEQTTQWPKEKVQKDQKIKQRSTKHTYNTKARVTRTPLKTGGELMCLICAI